jgi:DNA-3-methyladenine glycosylase II
MIMTDHPGWLTTDTGRPYRAVAADAGAALVAISGTADGDTVIDSGGRTVGVVWVDPSALAGPDDLISPLKAAGVVGRVANPSLWDALATAIMRQVIQAGHARTRYARFCRAYGDAVTGDGLTAWLFPIPEQVLALTDEQFAEVGAAFPMPALRDAARSFLDHGARWRTLPGADLVTALQTVPRVGPWTAKTAVADFTNDFSFYDYSDIAVQPAARRLNPDRDWPQGAPAFKAAWEELAANQLSDWTILTLTWGINHGKSIDRPTAS